MSKINLVVLNPNTGEILDPTDKDIIWSYLGLAGIKAVHRLSGETLAVSRQSDIPGPDGSLLYENQLIYGQILGWHETFDIFQIHWVPPLSRLQAFMKYGMQGMFANSVELYSLINATNIGNIYSHHLLTLEGNEYTG